MFEKPESEAERAGALSDRWEAERIECWQQPTHSTRVLEFSG